MPSGAAAKPNEGAGPHRVACSAVGCGTAQPHPFAWQDGRRLWILDGDCSAWVLAELEFDPRACRYVEVRRASYRWPREAAGALLGRAIGAGLHRAEDAARGLSEWAAASEAS